MAENRMTDESLRSGLLTLVVPIHGQIEHTLKFLDSYERQSVKAPLLFVDDRSPDDSVSILRKRGYEVYVPDERLWFNGALRMAVRECETPLLGFLNNDLVLGKDFIKDTLATFEATGYDFLVPRTVDLNEYEYLDAHRPIEVKDLIRQEGWCMIFRPEKLRRYPEIPVEFKLWFGDTWLFYHSWSFGAKVGRMENVRVFHAGSTSLEAHPDAEEGGQGEGHPQVKNDIAIRNSSYRWLRGWRNPPKANKVEERVSVDPASNHLIPVVAPEKGPDGREVCVGEGWPYLTKRTPEKDLGSVVLIVPMARIHTRFKDRFTKVANAAWTHSHGPFSSMKIEFIEDDEMRGAGWGRNIGMERNPDADWYFFVDVDDLPKPFCFEAMNHSTADVVWGVIEHRRRAYKDVEMVVNGNSFEVYEWTKLLSRGHAEGGGINNAFFVRGSLARQHRWFEGAFSYEDIEYFIVMAAHGTMDRLQFPLVTIDKLLSKPVDARIVDEPNHENIWMPLQNYWMWHGMVPLPEQAIQFRNGCARMQEFYP